VLVELNHGNDVPARWLIGGGSEVGEKLQGSKTVRLITLVRVKGSGRRIPTATRSGGGGEVNSNGDVPVINVSDGPAHKHQ
jgi:hypothetical protein